VSLWVATANHGSTLRRFRQTDWKWSSARHGLLDNHPVDPSLPTIHGLPADFLQ